MKNQITKIETKITTKEKLYFSIYQSHVLKLTHKTHPVDSYARRCVPRLVSTITDICANGWKFGASIESTSEKVNEYIEIIK